MAKFEPSDEKILLLIGQKLEAVGGLKKYSDGYLDHYNQKSTIQAYRGIVEMIRAKGVTILYGNLRVRCLLKSN